MDTLKRYAVDAFSGGRWTSAARHGIRCYSTARLHRRMRLAYEIPSPSEGLARDFGAVAHDLKHAVESRCPSVTGQK